MSELCRCIYLLIACFCFVLTAGTRNMVKLSSGKIENLSLKNTINYEDNPSSQSTLGHYKLTAILNIFWTIFCNTWNV